jgi:predicted  nucleic acid-binding Zn-ribbon protein
MPKASDELLRARRKVVAFERAKMRLRQQLERIDWELDELKPKVKDLEAAASRGELPEITVES